MGGNKIYYCKTETGAAASGSDTHNAGTQPPCRIELTPQPPHFRTLPNILERPPALPGSARRQGQAFCTTDPLKFHPENSMVNFNYNHQEASLPPSQCTASLPGEETRTLFPSCLQISQWVHVEQHIKEAKHS